jgi:hypothetical protein
MTLSGVRVHGGRSMHTGAMRARPFTSLLCCLTAVVALASAGCGGGSGQAALPPVELTSFASAAEASAKSSSARFSLDVTASVPGLAGELSFGATGAFDTPAERAQFEIDLSSFADLLGSFAGAMGGSSSGDLSTDPNDWRLEAIQDGGVVYIRFPLIADKLPDGKTWVKGDLATLAGQAGSGLGQFGSFAETDPRDAFAYLKAVAGDIEAVGSEELHGVETTHYRATIDVAKALDLVPVEQRGGLADLDQLIGQAGLSQLPVDVWLDASQRVHKLEMSFDFTAPGTSQSAGGAMTVEVWDYGVPVELDLPDDADVVDASALTAP